MPTLRQKVDNFCQDSGAKVDSDKLRNQVAMLKQEMKKVKEAHKHQLHLAKAAAKTVKVKAAPKAKTARVKMTDEQKGQRRRERAVAKELDIAQKRAAAPAEPMMPAPAPSLAPAKAGTRRRRVRPNLKLRW